jgi:putative DNA primase/helicase
MTATAPKIPDSAERTRKAELLDAMLAFVRANVAVIPIDDSTKRPAMRLLPIGEDGKPTWKPYQSEIASEDEVRRWVSAGVKAFAVVGGKISGGLLILDFDIARFYDAWCLAVGDLAGGLPGQKTGGGGYQKLLRCPDPGGNDKLAWVPDEDENSGRTIAIETRGEGGYAIVAPSLHPSGKYYAAMPGPALVDIPTVNQARADALLAEARKLDEAPLTRQEKERAEATAREAHQQRQAQRNGQASVIDAFNQAHHIEDVLQRNGYAKGTHGRYIRPGGKSESVSVKDGRSCHWSSNDPLNDGRGKGGCGCHDAFDVRRILDFGGDGKAAAKAIAHELGRNGKASGSKSATSKATTPEATEPLIVSRDDPYRAAGDIIDREFTGPDGPEIVHVGDAEQSILRFVGDCYHRVADPDLAHNVLNILADAQTYKPVKRKKDNAEDGKPENELVPFKPTTRYANEVAEGIKARRKCFAKAPCWLDDSPSLPDPNNLLVAANGIIDVASNPARIISPPTPKFFTLNALPYSFNRDAPEPAALVKYLDAILPDDPQAIECLQEFTGYLLTPWTNLQKALMLIGPPRAGKGVFLRVVTALLGAHNTCSPTLSSLGTPFGLAPLVDKLVAFISDARLSSRSDSAAVIETLLRIIGEDAVSVNRKYKDEISSTTIPARFILVANELPRLLDTSGAVASRFIVVRLEKSFLGHEDHGLTQRLLQELPSALNWALAGRARLRERGHFVQPSTGQSLADEFAELNSPIAEFLADCATIGADRAVDVADAWNAWNAWCEEAGREHRGNVQTLGRDLRAALPSMEISRPREGGERKRQYQGFGLTLAAIENGRKWQAKNAH